jgi:hypothetical protein
LSPTYYSFQKSDHGYLHPLAYDSPDDNTLTQRFHSFLPTQTPQDFTISPLPSKILSWITLVLQVGESSLTAPRKRQTKTKTKSGDAGNISAHEVASKLTPSSLLYTSFLGLYRTAKWSRNGELAGSRSKPVVGGTVLTAASSLAAVFRNDHRPSPLHHEGSTKLRPVFRVLLRAYGNQDPAPNRQKSITPRLLRALFDSSGAKTVALRDTLSSVLLCLSRLGVYKNKASRENKSDCPGGSCFRSSAKKTLPHHSTNLLALAKYVTIIFVDQKSGKKMDTRTQKRTGLPFLCPVLRFISLVLQIRRMVPNANASTNISTIVLNKSVLQITSTYTRTQKQAPKSTHPKART